MNTQNYIQTIIEFRLKHILAFILAYFSIDILHSQPETRQKAEFVFKHFAAVAASDSSYLITHAFDYFVGTSKSKNPTDSILKSIKSLALLNKDSNVLATYYLLRAIRRNTHNIDTICMYYDSAFVTAKKVGNKPIMYDAISGKSDDLFAASHYKESLEATLESIRLGEIFGDGYKLTLPKRYIRLSQIYERLGDSEREYNAATEGYLIAAKAGNTGERATSVGHLTNILAKRKDFTKAIELNRLLVHWTDSLGLNWKFINGHYAMASLYLEMNNLDSAKWYALNALLFLTKNNLDSDIDKCRYLLARVYDKTNKPDSAIYYLKQCLPTGKVFKNPNQLMQYYNLLSIVYAKIEDYKNSYEYLLKYNALHDTYLTEEKGKAAEEMSVRFETEKKNQEIKLLAQENKLSQANNERQQLIRNSIILLSIILFVFGGLLFNRFKLKKKIENQQAIINERKRISHELHDDLGAQLSTARMFLNSLKNNSDSDKNKSLVDNSIQLIDGSINDLRKIMDDLQVSTLQDKGYIFATEELVNKINQLQQIKFTLSHHGLEKRLEQKTEHNLFRITQELINNTIKYARAKNVSIDLIKRDEKIVLMYEDDGIGFDLQNASQGYGLSNIESRTKSLGGEVYIDTSPGTGFRATVETLLIYA